MQALDGIRTVAAGLDHPKAVTVSPDGTVWAGGEAGQVYRVHLESATVGRVAGVPLRPRLAQITGR